MNRKIVSQRRDYVKENIIRQSIDEIAEFWGVHFSTIEKDLIYLRTHENMKSKSEIRDERIKVLRSRGWSVEKIAKDLRITTRDVYYRIKKIGAS